VWLVQFCLFCCFYLLLPAYVVIAARASTNTIAAMGNGLLFATTVAAEFCAPALLARSGTRRVVVVALLGVGVGPLLLLLHANVWLLLAVAALRGAGFGMGAVAAVQLAMRLARGERARQRLSFFSLASAIPSIAGASVGLMLLHLWSTGSVVAATTAIALGGIGVGCLLLDNEESTRQPRSSPRSQLGIRSWFAAQTREERMLVVSVCVAVAFFYAVRGGFVIVAALDLPGFGLGGSTSFFLVNGLAFAAGRILAGLLPIARKGSNVLPAAALVAAAGILTMWWSGGRPAAVIAVAALSGIGVGLYAVESLVSLASSSIGEVRSSVLWNASIDIGLGGGGIVTGWVLATRLQLATSGTLTAMALCPVLAYSLAQRRL
jgi:predicted MFS family arabinose efflux permease